MWRLTYFVPIWVCWFLFVELTLLLLGIPIVAWLAWHHTVYRGGSNFYTSEDSKPRQILKWQAPWWIENFFGNEEDGVDGLPKVLSTDEVEQRQAWWADKTRRWSYFRIMFVWAGWRNSVSNLRFTKLGMKIDPARVGALIFPSGWLAWQGVRGRIHCAFKGRVLEVGWKVKPEDRFGMGAYDSRFPGVGFGMRLTKMVK